MSKTADEVVAEMLLPEVDLKILRLQERRAALADAANEIARIDAQLVALDVEKARYVAKLPVKSVAAQPTEEIKP